MLCFFVLWQVVGSIQKTNDLDVHIALLNAPTFASEIRNKFYTNTKTPHQIIREHVDMFGFMQKNVNALDILIEEAKITLQTWGNPQPPTFMLCNPKLTMQLTMTPEKTNFITQGYDGIRRLKQGPLLDSYRNLSVIHSRQYSLETGAPPRDLLRRRVRTAEYYRIPWQDCFTEHGDAVFLELYDEAKDTFFKISWDDLLKKAAVNKVPLSKEKDSGDKTAYLIEEVQLPTSAYYASTIYDEKNEESKKKYYLHNKVSGGVWRWDFLALQLAPLAIIEEQLKKERNLLKEALETAQEKIDVNSCKEMKYVKVLLGDITKILGDSGITNPMEKVLEKLNNVIDVEKCTFLLYPQTAFESEPTKDLDINDNATKEEANRELKNWQKYAVWMHTRIILCACAHCTTSDTVESLSSIFYTPPLVCAVTFKDLIEDKKPVKVVKAFRGSEFSAYTVYNAKPIPIKYDLVVVRPNIEHNMLAAILGRGGAEDLGCTFWGQTELSCYDDSMHGIWGMSYKYHERAIVTNERNLIRLFDVAYDGYNGGKDDRFIEWHDTGSASDAFLSFDRPYNGPSIMVMAFPVDPTNAKYKQTWPSPIVFHDEHTDAPGKSFVLDPENVEMVADEDMRVFNNLLYKTEYQKYLAMMPSFTYFHSNRKRAGLATSENETTCNSLAFQGTFRLCMQGAGQDTKFMPLDVKGSGHHGVDYVGVASVRNGKGYKITGEHLQTVRQV